MDRMMSMAKVSDWQVRGTPRLCWTDGVKVVLGSRAMTVEATQQCVIYRKKRRALVHVWMIEFNAAIFAWPCVISDRPRALWWIITLKGVGYRFQMQLETVKRAHLLKIEEHVFSKGAKGFMLDSCQCII